MTSHWEKVDEGKNCDVNVSSPQHNVIYTYEESHYLIQCLMLSQLKPVTFFFCSQLYLFCTSDKANIGSFTFQITIDSPIMTKVFLTQFFFLLIHQKQF